MNRFSRMTELRKLQEEAAALEVGRIQSRIAELRQQADRMQQETAQGRAEALHDLPLSGQRLPPGLYEEYYEGQAWRLRQNEQHIRQEEELLAKAMTAWSEARVRMKQVERMEESEGKRLNVEEERREAKVRDDRSGARHALALRTGGE
ncbi:MAG: hypothetical protein HQL51_04515 [Magnetococcales bacterium]|nr:hypothetical protein [Magnetococcales bacterium]